MAKFSLFGWYHRWQAAKKTAERHRRMDMVAGGVCPVCAGHRVSYLLALDKFVNCAGCDGSGRATRGHREWAASWVKHDARRVTLSTGG